MKITLYCLLLFVLCTSMFACHTVKKSVANNEATEVSYIDTTAPQRVPIYNMEKNPSRIINNDQLRSSQEKSIK